MTEALLNNERCFLEKDSWKAVFRSVIVEDAFISDRSGIVIELMILKSNIPGLFVDVTNIIYHRNSDRLHINAIADKLCRLRADLYEWHSRYEVLLTSGPQLYPGSPEFERKCKVFATYLSCVIISSRLLGVLSSTERVELEQETQLLASQMLDLELEVKAAFSAAAMFMAQTLGVAQSTIATSKDWLRGESPSTRYRSSNDIVNEGLEVGKVESVSPDGFTSGVESPKGPPSATQSSDGTSSHSPPVAAVPSGLARTHLVSSGFSSSYTPSSDSYHTPELEGLLEKWKFDKWCAKLGRKTPS